MQEPQKLTEEQLNALVKQEQELEQAELEKGVYTKVTSVAEENKKGANIKLPNPEEIVTKVSMAHITQKKVFNDLFGSKALSARARQRIMNALLDLPMDNMRSLFKSDVEYQTFLVGQTVLNYKFTIITHHVIKASNEAKVLEKNADKNNNLNLGE